MIDEIFIWWKDKKNPKHLSKGVTLTPSLKFDTNLNQKNTS